MMFPTLPRSVRSGLVASTAASAAMYTVFNYMPNSSFSEAAEAAEVAGFAVGYLYDKPNILSAYGLAFGTPGVNAVLALPIWMLGLAEMEEAIKLTSFCMTFVNAGIVALTTDAAPMRRATPVGGDAKVDSKQAVKTPNTFSQRLEKLKEQYPELVVKHPNVRRLIRFVKDLKEFEHAHRDPVIGMGIINDPVTLSTGGSVDRQTMLQYLRNRGRDANAKCPITNRNLNYLEANRYQLPASDPFRSKIIKDGLAALEHEWSLIKKLLKTKPMLEPRFEILKSEYRDFVTRYRKNAEVRIVTRFHANLLAYEQQYYSQVKPIGSTSNSITFFSDSKRDTDHKSDHPQQHLTAAVPANSVPNEREIRLKQLESMWETIKTKYHYVPQTSDAEASRSSNAPKATPT